MNTNRRRKEEYGKQMMILVGRRWKMLISFPVKWDKQLLLRVLNEVLPTDRHQLVSL